MRFSGGAFERPARERTDKVAPIIRACGVILKRVDSISRGICRSLNKLAMLSLITRKNSRHPLLVIGLFALGIMFLAWRIMPALAGERALTISQAFAIVENTPMSAAPDAAVGIGIYLGLVASAVLVSFGLTIVVKRASTVYVVTSADDDVD